MGCAEALWQAIPQAPVEKMDEGRGVPGVRRAATESLAFRFFRHSGFLPFMTSSLPIHFFTIVLNGMPFLPYHAGLMRRLSVEWHWHFVEGVAELKHDTPARGRITPELHRDGLSRDGTTEHLDALAREFPGRIHIHRKPKGEFWDGKREMVNAPLTKILAECLLWEVDADEFWTAEQVDAAHSLFVTNPRKKAAYYYCHYFVGDRLALAIKPGQFGNHVAYEWLRTWRYKPGMRWKTHEPPDLVERLPDGSLRGIRREETFRHEETRKAGLVFQHYAYAAEEQLRFKEVYYGYPRAVEEWRTLQRANTYPRHLRDYFSWVRDGEFEKVKPWRTRWSPRFPSLVPGAKVHTVAQLGVRPLALRAMNGEWSFAPAQAPAGPARIVLVRADAIGDNVLSGGLVAALRAAYPHAALTMVCPERTAPVHEASPHLNEVVVFDKEKARTDRSYRTRIIGQIRALRADWAVNLQYSRDPLSDIFTVFSGAPRRVAFEGDLLNIRPEQSARFDRRYTEHVTASGNLGEFGFQQAMARALGVLNGDFCPRIDLTSDERAEAEAFFAAKGLDPIRTVALFAGTLRPEKNYAYYGEALALAKGLRGFSVLALGDGPSGFWNSHALRQCNLPAIDLTGSIPLRRAAAILARCRLALGGDSALAHIACALGVPHVIAGGGGIFGRFLPYSPLTSLVALPLECYGCGWNCRYDSFPCVQAIAPRGLALAIDDLLEGLPPLPRLYLQKEPPWRNTDVSLPRRGWDSAWIGQKVELREF